MKETLWIFEKTGRKWKSRLNGKFFAELYETTGLPFEIALDEIEKWSLEQRIISKLNSWRQLKLDEKTRNDKKISWNEFKEQYGEKLEKLNILQE